MATSLVKDPHSALVHELRGDDEPRLPALLSKLSPVDLVLIEGYKRKAHPKLEIHRASLGLPLLATADPAILAIASDMALPSAKVPVIALDDLDAIVEVLIRSAAPLDSVLAQAGMS